MPTFDLNQTNLSKLAVSDNALDSAKDTAHPNPLLATDYTPPLATHIENSVRQYFNELGNQDVTDVYDLMLQQFERPLLTVIYDLTKGNQTHMAEILGLNRGTLRKKLKRYDFIK